MSRAHKDLTDDERKALARVTHARNRLDKLDGHIERMTNYLKSLKAEKKRLEQEVKS